MKGGRGQAEALRLPDKGFLLHGPPEWALSVLMIEEEEDESATADNNKQQLVQNVSTAGSAHKDFWGSRIFSFSFFFLSHNNKRLWPLGHNPIASSTPGSVRLVSLARYRGQAKSTAISSRE